MITNVIDTIRIRTASLRDFDGVVATDHMSRKDKLRVAIKAGECFVAEADSRGSRVIVGFAVLKYTFFDNGFIELLVARENARRQGVATALLTHVRRKCSTKKLFTSTNESNAPMRALLEKSGFVFCGKVYALDEGDPECFFVSQIK